MITVLDPTERVIRVDLRELDAGQDGASEPAEDGVDVEARQRGRGTSGPDCVALRPGPGLLFRIVDPSVLIRNAVRALGPVVVPGISLPVVVFVANENNHAARPRERSDVSQKRVQRGEGGGDIVVEEIVDEQGASGSAVIGSADASEALCACRVP